ncbi:MAG: DUF4332 domain-containing protein [Thermoplasmatota archaeon]
MYTAWDQVPRRRKIPFTYNFYFPRSVESALYVNNYIPIDRQGNMLKLRTLLAGPKDGNKKDLPRDKQFPKKADPTKPKAVYAPGQGPPGSTSEGAVAGPGYDPGQAPPGATSAGLFGGPPAGAAMAANAPVATPAPAPPASPGSPYKPRPIVVGAGDGREFLAELETRIKERDEQKAEAFRSQVPSAPESFYDYMGTVHDIEDIEGIGKTFGFKLREIGIFTTARLAYEDADKVAQAVGVPRKTVESWQAMGELLKVSGIGPQYAEALARGGVSGIAELKRRSAESIAEQVNAYLASLKSTVVGSSITAKRVEGWQKAAKDMRRVRLKIPEK